MKTIRGKRALVTGAASGIGRDIALTMALEGVDLYLVDIDAPALANVVHDARRCGVEAHGVACDVARPEAITACLAGMLSGWGHVDIVVNNAGIVYYGPTEKMTAEQWDRLLAINLRAPIQITRELLPTLLARRESHVLNVCSISGLVAGPRLAAYHVSKFGLVGFSEALRAEFGRRGVGVTALCPGPVRTRLYKSGESGRKRRPIPEPPAWLCASSQRVADKAVAAIKRNRGMVLVTPFAHLLFNTKRFAPWFLDRLNHLALRKKKLKAPRPRILRPAEPFGSAVSPSTTVAGRPADEARRAA